MLICFTLSQETKPASFDKIIFYHLSVNVNRNSQDYYISRILVHILFIFLFLFDFVFVFLLILLKDASYQILSNASVDKV